MDAGIAWASDKYPTRGALMTPSKILLGLELIRGTYELGLGIALKDPLKSVVPYGDGHPVMIIPGLAGSDESTLYLRDFVDSIGYRSFSWGLGRNLGPRDGLDQMLDSVKARLNEIYHQSGRQPVSIIGWSLGGIYARELAKASPDFVRQVITLGTPFKGAGKMTNVSLLYEFLSKDKSHKNPDIIRRLESKPPVPFTSIYSKTDGVVHWQASLEEETDISENIEIVGASHLGLGHNPMASLVISDRLTNTKDNWKKYNRQ